MVNVFDYLDWRGDLSIEQSPLNEIDSMILSRLSYAPFEYIENEISEKPLSINDAAQSLLKIPNIKEIVLLKDDLRLIIALSENERFNSMTLHYFENLIDLETQTQFSAITIQLKKRFIFHFFSWH